MLHRNLPPAILSMTPYFKRRDFRRRSQTVPYPLPEGLEPPGFVELRP
jgi:hypothetical protein